MLRDMDAAPITLDSAVLTAIEQRYAAPGRYYHTWEHIRACLRHFHTVSWDHPREVWCAFLFHDIIYDVQRTDNEAQSAELAATMLQGVDIDIEQVKHLIVLTAHHAQRHKLAQLDGDARQFLDVDAAILGAEAAVYDTYALNVRREYGGHNGWTAALYNVGRGRFLRKMLATEPLFLSPTFAERLTGNACNNLHREWRNLPLYARLLA